LADRASQTRSVQAACAGLDQFSMTSEIQSRRRLGLTATLVREDGREGEVFSLIGPKRFDTPWREPRRGL
jgi:superfamily II DNA or RNA helicase